MYYLGPIVTWFVKQRVSAIRKMMEQPHETQQQVFNDLIREAADTEWGRKYDYASTKSYADFQNRVPIQDYDTLKPFIQRMMNGEQNVLWPTPVKWFSKSSGTTSDVSKFIPMTYESIEDCHYKAEQEYGADSPSSSWVACGVPFVKSIWVLLIIHFLICCAWVFDTIVVNPTNTITKVGWRSAFMEKVFKCLYVKLPHCRMIILENVGLPFLKSTA